MMGSFAGLQNWEDKDTEMFTFTQYNLEEEDTESGIQK